MSIYYFTIFFSVLIGYGYERFKDKSILILFFIIFFSLIYGFRFEVGVDWDNYIVMYERLVSDLYLFNTPEFGYKLLNVIAYYIDEGIVTVIFLQTILFFGFSFFALKNLGLNPFYFFAIVAPYHLVMSGVNLTRQSISISVFIYAVSFLVKNKKYYFLFFILLAGSFHTSALIFAPLFFIELKKRYAFLALICFGPLIIFLMLLEYNQYLNTRMENAGLYLRALYLIGPTVLLILHIKSLSAFSLIEKRLCYFVCLSFPFVMSISFLSTTMADRISYYLIVLSTICWMLLSKRNDNFNPRHLRSYGNFILFISSLLAFIVWTLYSSYIPYYIFDSYIFH